MAGNKFDTAFKEFKPTVYRLTYLDPYGDEVNCKGTPKQIINSILNQQL